MRTSGRFTTDGVGLLILGVIATIRGVSYLPFVVEPDRKPLHLLEYVLGSQHWAWLWIAIGVFAVAAVVVDVLRPAAVGLIIGLYALWTVSYLGFEPRGWVVALNYAQTAVLALWAFGRGRRTDMPTLPRH